MQNRPKIIHIMTLCRLDKNKNEVDHVKRLHLVAGHKSIYID